MDAKRLGLSWPGAGILFPAEMIFETTGLFLVMRSASAIPVEQPQPEKNQVESEKGRQDQAPPGFRVPHKQWYRGQTAQDRHDPTPAQPSCAEFVFLRHAGVDDGK